MPIIKLQTKIYSDIETCFDLARSIDLHKISTAHTNENAIAGIQSGLIELGQFVTWEATHFGVTQKLTSKITEYNRPFHFQDIQLKGPFKYFLHDHDFKAQDNFVIMQDTFDFKSPLNFLGAIVDKLLMTNYLTELLIKRNRLIKEYAESDKWTQVLDPGA